MKSRSPEEIAVEIIEEYRRAERKFGPFNNGHEGYAVIKEELDELWKAVKSKDPMHMENARKKAIQIGAVAMRFAIDLYIKTKETPDADKNN